MKVLFNAMKRGFQMMSSKAGCSGRLIWIDCEMTGLDVSRHTLVEIACIVTDGDLETVAEGPDLVISHPPNVLERMSPWCKSTFTKNGLLEKIQSSNISMESAESQVLSFLEKHTNKGECPLAGNSVSADRRFIEKCMPKLAKHFHYRTVDVSSFKEMARRWYPEVFAQLPEKKSTHRALDDIRESIEELKWYRKNIFK